MPSFPTAATDVRGKHHILSEAPERIICLVPSITELLAWLGLEERVVGITRFCVHPEGWKEEKRIVGGTKQVNYERIEELAPDLIIANREENTKEMVETLDDVAPVFVTDVATLPEALSMIRTVGRLVGCATRADALATNIDARFSELPTFPPLRAAYLIWRKPYMTVGGDTFVHELLSYAGFVNAYADQSRYPEVTLEDLAAAELDVLLLASEPFPFQEKYVPEFKEVLPSLPIELVDGELFSWYGSRLLHAPSYFATLRERMTPLVDSAT